MRSLAILVTVAALVLGTASIALAAPRDPFKGPWVSIDTVDGSSQRLTFGGNGATRNATLRDAGATVCGYPAVDASTVARGSGTVAGTTISVDWSGRCQPTGDTWEATVTLSSFPAPTPGGVLTSSVPFVPSVTASSSRYCLTSPGHHAGPPLGDGEHGRRLGRNLVPRPR